MITAAVTNSGTAALGYALDRCWYVLPLTSRGPAVSEDGSTRVAREIALLWGRFGGAGVGVDLERSGLAVVDAPLGTVWRSGRVPRTFESQDGEGRRLFWFRLRNGDSADPAHLPMDCRIHVDGILPAPPTYAGRGHRWAWKTEHAVPAEIPGWLACTRKNVAMPTPPEAAAVARGWITASDALQLLDAALERIEPTAGGWNRDLYEAAYLAGRLAGAELVPKTTAQLLLVAAASSRAGIPQAAARKLISDPFDRGMEHMLRALVKETA